MKTFLLAVAIVCSLAVAAFARESAGTGFAKISTEELKTLLDKERNITVVDARSRQEYEEVHIKDAVSIPVAELEKNPALLPPDKSRKVVFYCNGVKCGKSGKAAKIALANGYTNVVVYAEGMPVWEEKGLPIYAGAAYEKKVDTKKLTPKELKALIAADPAALTIVDVRDPAEFAAGHIPGSINIPAAEFASRSGVLEKEKRIIVYCNSGGRSYNAYRKLMKLAYPNINQVIFADWEFDGYPVEK